LVERAEFELRCGLKALVRPPSRLDPIARKATRLESSAISLAESVNAAKQRGPVS
jgi:hypothetical protein